MEGSRQTMTPPGGEGAQEGEVPQVQPDAGEQRSYAERREEAATAIGPVMTSARAEQIDAAAAERYKLLVRSYEGMDWAPTTAA